MSQKPRSLRWALDEHSHAKHAVLREYLKAWLPISAFSEDSFLFVDGFAGPGRYSTGEEGSPTIALRTYLEHRARPRFAGTPYFAFIEGDYDRAAALEAEVKHTLDGVASPPPCDVEHGTFHEVLASLRDHLTERRLHLKPAFVMVDPFGIADTPMSDLVWLISNPKCELYVSLMASFITRFEGTESFEQALDALYGTHAWHDFTDLPHPEKRVALLNLYERQLRTARPGLQVLRFDLFEGNAYKYTIFHASRHERACERMKQAIWTLDPSGRFQFRGRGDVDQLSLFGPRPWSEALCRELLERIPPPPEWTTVAELETYLRSDRTRFHPGQLKTALNDLERDGQIVADPLTRRRRGEFPSRTRVQRASR